MIYHVMTQTRAHKISTDLGKKKNGWVGQVLCTFSFAKQTNARANASSISIMELTELRVLTRWLSGRPNDGVSCIFDIPLGVDTTVY